MTTFVARLTPGACAESDQASFETATVLAAVPIDKAGDNSGPGTAACGRVARQTNWGLDQLQIYLFNEANEATKVDRWADYAERPLTPHFGLAQSANSVGRN